MRGPGNRNVSKTHSLFVDDLKQYQNSHKVLKGVNEIIVQARHDTGTCYKVSKCPEIVFEHEKMVRGEALPVLDERMETMGPDENKIYKSLGIEQADGIKIKVVFERVKRDVEKRVKMLVNTGINHTNLINVKVIPVVAYSINVCKFSKGELNDSDQIINRALRSKQMLGNTQAMRLYLKREDGGR